eukprot:5864405-Amphidinium_carterae.1
MTVTVLPQAKLKSARVHADLREVVQRAVIQLYAVRSAHVDDLSSKIIQVHNLVKAKYVPFVSGNKMQLRDPARGAAAQPVTTHGIASAIDIDAVDWFLRCAGTSVEACGGDGHQWPQCH